MDFQGTSAQVMRHNSNVSVLPKGQRPLTSDECTNSSSKLTSVFAGLSNKHMGHHPFLALSTPCVMGNCLQLHTSTPVCFLVELRGCCHHHVVAVTSELRFPLRTPSFNLLHICVSVLSLGSIVFLCSQSNRPAEKTLTFRDRGLVRMTLYGTAKWVWESLNFLSQFLLLNICTQVHHVDFSSRSMAIMHRMSLQSSHDFIIIVLFMLKTEF